MSSRAWLAFLALGIIWGVPYFFIKLAVQELSPWLIAWARIVLATLILLPIAWRRGAKARHLQPATRPDARDTGLIGVRNRKQTVPDELLIGRQLLHLASAHGRDARGSCAANDFRGRQARHRRGDHG